MSNGYNILRDTKPLTLMNKLIVGVAISRLFLFRCFQQGCNRQFRQELFVCQRWKALILCALIWFKLDSQSEPFDQTDAMLHRVQRSLYKVNRKEMILGKALIHKTHLLLFFFLFLEKSTVDALWGPCCVWKGWDKLWFNGLRAELDFNSFCRTLVLASKTEVWESQLSHERVLKVFFDDLSASRFEDGFYTFHYQE